MQHVFNFRSWGFWLACTALLAPVALIVGLLIGLQLYGNKAVPSHNQQARKSTDQQTTPSPTGSPRQSSNTTDQQPLRQVDGMPAPTFKPSPSASTPAKKVTTSPTASPSAQPSATTSPQPSDSPTPADTTGGDVDPSPQDTAPTD